MAKPLKLEEMAPEAVGIVIYDLDGVTQIPLTLRPFSIDDQVWLKNNYTPEELQLAFNAVNMHEITKITYHQLDDESKRKLLAVETTEINDEGDEVSVRYTGPQRFRKGVVGVGHMALIMQALMKSIGISMPPDDLETGKADTGGKADEKKSS